MTKKQRRTLARILAAAVLLVEDLMVAVTPGPLGDGRCQLLLPADYSAIPVRREEKCLLYPRG